MRKGGLKDEGTNGSRSEPSSVVQQLVADVGASRESRDVYAGGISSERVNVVSDPLRKRRESRSASRFDASKSERRADKPQDPASSP